MSTTDLELIKIVRSFRISDLQSLLNYAGRNKEGKKCDLQRRALDLIKLRSAAISVKIRELHQNRIKPYHGKNETQDNQYKLTTARAPVEPGIVIPISHRQSLLAASSIPGLIQNAFNPVMLPTAPFNMVYPTNLNVRFKNLPFYDVLGELLQPTNLVALPDERFQEMRFAFTLSSQQVLDLQSGVPDVQVQLRICVLDTTCAQDDEIPVSICLKINGAVYNLPRIVPSNRPEQEPRRPKIPLDITNYIKRTFTESNEVVVSYASKEAKPYAMGIFFVLKQNSLVLLQRLKSKGASDPRATMNVIMEKLGQDRDSEIAATSLKGSLVCPLVKKKMIIPCRATTCTHLQCFDAATYLKMNEMKAKWICPVCDKPAHYKDLTLDGLFLDIILNAPIDCTEVQFQEDGTWSPIMPVEKQSEVTGTALEPIVNAALEPIAAIPKKVTVVNLDSDSDMEDCLILSPEQRNEELEDAIKVFNADAFSPRALKSVPNEEGFLPQVQNESPYSLLPTPMNGNDDCHLVSPVPNLTHHF